MCIRSNSVDVGPQGNLTAFFTGRWQAPRVVLTVLAACIVCNADGQGYLIDQSLLPPPNTGGSYHYDAVDSTLIPSTGQEFTPSFDGLDFVNVLLFGPGGGTFQVSIHDGSITGLALGISEQVVSAGSGYTHFNFLSTVSLTPGNTYVFEVIQNDNSSGWFIELPTSAVVNGQTIDMNYSGGRLIYGGVPQSSYDMIFSEGINVVPEPRSVDLFAIGVALAFLVKRGGRRKVLAIH